MKKIFVLLAAFAACLSSAFAGSVETRFVADETEKTPLNVFDLESSYVFDSDLSGDNDDDFGDQDAFSFRAEYSRRFRLTGRWYLRAGVSYDRFDFGETSGPVPEQLHSLAAVISIDYMVGADRGAFLEFRPGFYAEDDFHGDSFDVPMTLARAWVLQRDKLFLITGVNVAFLRGQFPVLPIIGVVWHPCEQWLLYGVLPDPRLVYMPNKKLNLWIGGELSGGSFRTNRSDTIFPQKLSNAVVDYSEYRAGLGLVWHATDSIDLDLAGGYAFLRRFNFERADEDFSADPAPYVRVALKAEF